MKLDQLVACIETLKKRMDAHREILESNEAHTRVALIDPLLNALGWDVADPSQVSYEHYVDSARKHRERADYGLMGLDKHNNGSKPVAILEAKKLGADLDSHKKRYWAIRRRLVLVILDLLTETFGDSTMINRELISIINRKNWISL